MIENTDPKIAELIMQEQKRQEEGLELIANVFIKDYQLEILNENTQVKSSYISHENSGIFHLVLKPGSYTLIFKRGKIEIGKKEIVVLGNLEYLDIRL